MSNMEIKFRAWDKVYEHFHEGDIVREYCLGDFIDNPEYVVTQYTCLKDRQGNELYYGDCVVFYYGKNKNDLVWDITDFSDFQYLLNEIYERGASFEIIGNIFENPGLLK